MKGLTTCERLTHGDIAGVVRLSKRLGWDFSEEEVHLVLRGTNPPMKAQYFALAVQAYG
ncbi:hypothetical protein [Laceyella putida]|uniref:Uncharacterized protein n=1 Tax=Laceyella putida TaxID=110101 RepID=A0ABW2RQB9_9BACL